MSETLEYTMRTAVPVERVRAALSDPAELRVWLAESATAPPEGFAFAGPSVPEGGGNQVLTAFEDDRLAFTWPVSGKQTAVEITLRQAETATVVQLTQTGFAGWAVAASGVDDPLALLGTYWALTLANLVEHVEGRELTPRADLTSATMSTDVLIAGSAKEVFDALTDPAKFAEWFGYPVGIEPEAGGRWAMGGFENNPNPARITVFEPGRAMALDFGADFGVTAWELEESGGKTRMTVVHSGFDPGNPPYGSWLGWLSGFAELRRYLEMPEWSPMFATPAAPADPEA